MNLAVREAGLSFRRTPLLAVLSVLMIAFSLFTFGLFGLVALNLRSALDQLAERVEVVAFILRGTPAEAITLASDDIAAFPEVLGVRYVSEDDALARAREELVEFRDAFQDLSVNPLPASLEIRLRPEYRDAANARQVAERLRGYGFIDDVRYGEDWVSRLDRLRNIAGGVGLVIGGAFALVAVVIIGVSIRMTVLHRAREIQIMRLVGATDGFIRAPFLLEGMVKGTLGGVLAVGLSWAGYQLFRSGAGLGATDLLFFSSAQALLLIVAGLAIGFGGSVISVTRHLRRV